VTISNAWSSLDEAVRATRISASHLRSLKRSGALPAGTAWVYLTGNLRGRVGWSIAAIQQWQHSRTVELIGAEKDAAAAIETYESVGAR
jgi:hypothetical protein